MNKQSVKYIKAHGTSRRPRAANLKWSAFWEGYSSVSMVPLDIEEELDRQFSHHPRKMSAINVRIVARRLNRIMSLQSANVGR